MLYVSRLSLQILLIFLLGFVFRSVQAQVAPTTEYVPGEVIIKLRNQTGPASTQLFMGKAASEKSMSLKASFEKMNLYHYKLNKNQSVENSIKELSQDPDVEYVEPNYIFHKAESTGIVQTFTQEQMEVIAQSNSSWSTGGANIGLDQFHQSKAVSSLATTKPIVAVIDTGLDLNHSVFVNTQSVWTNLNEIPGNGIDDDHNGYVDDIHGWNFVDNSGSMYDDDGHGTHVSGIILSVDQDTMANPLQDSRIAIMPLKFLDGNGSGTTANAIKAIYYAVQNGAVVLNNSWGGSSYSGALLEAIAYSYSNHASFVAAAGNSAQNTDSSPMYPASYSVPNIISVAATTSQDNLASFSNFGKSTVHLGSPGVLIYSTIPGGWGTSSGTSMAAPFVSGVAIQMKVEAPQMNGYQIKSIIVSQTDTVSGLSSKVSSSGRLSATQSIDYSKTAVVDPSQPEFTNLFTENRELASTLSGTGCGLVTKLAQNPGDKFGGTSPIRGPETWYVLFVLALLVAPIAITQYLKTKTPENRRKFERFKIQSEVTMKVGEKELVGSISSISLGGVQLNAATLLENGGIVKMSICSPDGKEQVDVEGSIVWSEVGKSYGVAFQNAPRSVLYRIGEWTKALKPSS
ncbi:MAG: S8 family serine peptidase [Bdellovibrionales bacterium]|nr:S8 family serine peptidase [Bdellovibrionales bacterium]